MAVLKQINGGSPPGGPLGRARVELSGDGLTLKIGPGLLYDLMLPESPGRERAERISVEGPVTVDASSSQLFRGFSSLREIVGAEKLDTSRMTDMNYMFRGCSRLETLDVSSWDTRKLRYAIGMFEDCSLLETTGLSRWAVFKILRKRDMFKGCPVRGAPRPGILFVRARNPFPRTSMSV